MRAAEPGTRLARTARPVQELLAGAVHSTTASDPKPNGLWVTLRPSELHPRTPDQLRSRAVHRVPNPAIAMATALRPRLFSTLALGNSCSAVPFLLPNPIFRWDEDSGHSNLNNSQDNAKESAGLQSILISLSAAFHHQRTRGSKTTIRLRSRFCARNSCSFGRPAVRCPPNCCSMLLRTAARPRSPR